MTAHPTDREPLPDTGRVQTFSDGVFAIAITLLVLEIRVPRHTDHLLHDLGRLWPSYLAYVVSFLLIGLVWANHHVMFDHIRLADRLLLFLNTLLLLDVAFLPFVAAVLAASLRDGTGQPVAVALYGGTLAIGGVFFNAIWEHARRDHRLLGESITPQAAQGVSRRFLLGPALYAIAACVGYAVPALGIALFAALILVYWFPIAGQQRLRRKRREIPDGP